MTIPLILAAIFTALGVTFALFRKGGIYNPADPDISDMFEPPQPVLPETATISNPAVTTPISQISAPETMLWATPKQAYHSTRVLCDTTGLSLENKNIVCATIYGESEFKIRAVGKNATSTDYSLCQFNDGPPGVAPEKKWWIGPGKLFSSPEDVFANPERQVLYMINYLKENGHLNMWYAYKDKDGTYPHKKHLLPTSKMWLLKV